MTLTSPTDAATALAAVRAQRAAASLILEVLDQYRRYQPRGECLPDWAGPASVGYSTDLVSLLMLLGEVRSGLTDAVDDLWIVIGEAGDD